MGTSTSASHILARKRERSSNPWAKELDRVQSPGVRGRGREETRQNSELGAVARARARGGGDGKRAAADEGARRTEESATPRTIKEHEKAAEEAVLLRNAATRVTFLFLFHTTTTQHHPSALLHRSLLSGEGEGVRASSGSTNNTRPYRLLALGYGDSTQARATGK